MESKTYIGLTIGPIYELIGSARRTRMAWAGSYLFSYLIRELAFGYLKGAIHQFKEKLILPSKQVQDPEQTLGAGIYPDRIIFEAEEGDFAKVQTAIDTLVRQVAVDIHAHIHETAWGFERARKVRVEEVEAYLHAFVKLYSIQIPVQPGEGEAGNILLRLYERLDVLELRNKVVVDGQHDYLQHFLFRVNKLNKQRQTSFLQQDAFGRQNPRRRFESLMEISTRGLARLEGFQTDKEVGDILTRLGINNVRLSGGTAYAQFVDQLITRFQVAEDEMVAQLPDAEEDNEQAQDKFLQALAQYYGSHFQDYHKYIAVIHADGDNIGALLKKIGHDPGQLRQFSGKLIDFNLEAVKLAADYGAAPVYIGGEDLFLFAPVACLTLPDAEGKQRLRTVFDLVTELDAAFGKCFSQEVKELGLEKAPTLSWGIAVGYYKHPLIDTMGHAYRLMKSSKDEKRHPNKNTISYRVQSHSGQYYEAAIEKDKAQSWRQFQDMLQLLACEPGEVGAEDKATLIHGITHRLKDPLFGTLLEQAVQRQTVGTLIANQFNEPFHRRPENQGYLQQLEALTLGSYWDYAPVNSGAAIAPSRAKREMGTAANYLYSALRFIDFIDSKPQKD